MGIKQVESAKISPKELASRRLENNLNQKVDKLKDLITLDKELAAILEKLKKDLIDEIKFGGDDMETPARESYLDDMKLDMNELKEIYEMPHLRILFNEAGINSFELFISFLSDDSGMEYDSKKGLSLLKIGGYLLNGEIVELNVMVGLFNDPIKVAAQLKSILDNVRKNPEIAAYIVPKSVRSIGAHAIEFSAMENETSVDYIAVKSSIYKIKQKSDTIAGKAGTEKTEYMAEDIETGGTFRIISDSNHMEFIVEKLDDKAQTTFRETFDLKYGNIKNEQQTGPDEWDVYEKTFEGKFVMHASMDNSGTRFVHYREDGTIYKIDDRKFTTVFNENGSPLLRIYKSQKGKTLRAFIYDDMGNPIGLFPEEKDIDPDMTEEKYLNYLAKQLNTPAKLGAFMNFYMKYKFDTDYSSETASVFENILNHLKFNYLGHNEYWQQAPETVRRVEKGMMRGDCDDYAFLAKDILDRQTSIDGIERNAHVIHVRTAKGDHAICVWSIRRPDGKYDFYRIGTEGLNVNGRMIDSNLNLDIGKPENSGFTNASIGLQAIIRPYDDPSKSEPLNPIDDTISLLEIPSEGQRRFVPGVPVEIFVDKEAYSSWKRLQPYLEASDFEGFDRIVSTLPPRDYYSQWAARKAEKIGNPEIAAHYKKIPVQKRLK